jgi:hypothetical protein
MIRKIVVLFCLVLAFYGCDKEKHLLKWKIPQGEVLIYSIKMETIDSLSSVTEDNMKVLVDMVARMYGDSLDLTVTENDLYHGLVKQLNMLSYFAIIRQAPNQEIKIDFITKQVKEYEQIKYLDIFNKFIRKAFFKGSLTTNGRLIHESGAPVFDPKINILFELPEKPVSVGDSWSLNIRPPDHAINKAQLDSIKNQVTFSDMIIENDDSIAILDYSLQSPDKAGNAIRFTGKVKFSITQGKWLDYTGVLSQKTSGLLPMNHVQKIKLTEISVETYKSIIKQAQKQDIFGYKVQNEEGISSLGNDGENEKEPDCPVIYRIQLLATQNPIQDKQTEFNNIPFKVEEIIPDPSEKFRYKYTVGKFCNMEEAKRILAEIQKLGFTGAYVIKSEKTIP